MIAGRSLDDAGPAVFLIGAGAFSFVMGILSVVGGQWPASIVIFPMSLAVIVFGVMVFREVPRREKPLEDQWDEATGPVEVAREAAYGSVLRSQASRRSRVQIPSISRVVAQLG
jgi:membrane protein implicated in regulation of membrane protease activity